MKPALLLPFLLLLPACSPTLPPPLTQVRESNLRGTIDALVACHNRNTLSTQDSSTTGIGAAANLLEARFKAAANGRLIVERQTIQVTELSDRIPHPISLTNILATLPGSAPEAERKVIIVSGHYDSRAADVLDTKVQAPGANDDGSGTAVVLECARILAAAPPMRHTIVFATVSGEEQGLTGAAALAAKAKAESWPLIAMITNDIVGNTTGGSGQDGRGRLRVFSEGVPTSETPLQIQQRQSLGGESDGPSRQLARYLQTAAESANPDFKITQTFRRDRYARGGDHIPFLRQGYAAVRLTEPYEDFRRQHANVTTRPNGTLEGDLPQYIDYFHLAQVTRANLAVLSALASAPPAPTRATIDSSLSYDTTLTWEKSPGATRYIILYRDTTAPTWQHRVDAGNSTTLTLKNLSKDDYQFAITAQDPQGHESLPAIPQPKRNPR